MNEASVNCSIACTRIESASTSLGTRSEVGSAVEIHKNTIAVLDAETGHFVIRNQCHEPETQSTRNVILDEKTGHFLSEGSDNSSFFSESDFSASESEYHPSTESDLSMNGSSSVLLNESSGVITVKRARKGQGDKQNWTRKLQKLKRMRGREYSSNKRSKKETGVMEIRKERSFKARCRSEVCAKKFGKQCNEISEEDRKDIFKTFWLLSWEEKRAFVVAMVSQKPVTSRTTGTISRRVNTLVFVKENMMTCKT